MIPIEYLDLVLLMGIAFMAGVLITFSWITKGKVFDDKGRLIPEEEYKQQKEKSVKHE